MGTLVENTAGSLALDRFFDGALRSYFEGFSAGASSDRLTRFTLPDCICCNRREKGTSATDRAADSGKRLGCPSDDDEDPDDPKDESPSSYELDDDEEEAIAIKCELEQALIFKSALDL